MRIAILGATSQIAKDLLLSFSALSNHELVLYARRPEAVSYWLAINGLKGRYHIANLSNFKVEENFDTVINFVGVGNPVQTMAMGASIFDVTQKYDELALDYIRQHTDCRYIFLSSGASYGASFDAPVDENTLAAVAINHLQPQDWYGVAKLYAECRHRALANLPIVDVRVFNYFSHTQDLQARFLITDIVRAIRDKTVLKTSAAYMARDYLHPSDFYRLVEAILISPATNAAVDCYSKAPLNKTDLLAALQEKFGLKYEIIKSDATVNATVNATGNKKEYYSKNRRAKEFGYDPKLTSLEGILQEMKIIFQYI